MKKALIVLLCMAVMLPAGVLLPREALSAAITMKGWTTGANGGSGGEDDVRLRLDKPSQTRAGDLMVAQITFEKGSDIASLVGVSGWKLMARNNRGSDIGQVIYTRVAGASEPSSYTWQFRKSDGSYENVRAAGGIVVFSGVDTVSPVVSYSGSQGDAGETGVLTAPSLTAAAGSRLLAFYGYKKQVDLSPSGLPELYEKRHANQSGPTVMLAEASWNGGATGSRTASFSPSDQTDKWVAHLIALRPAGSADAGGGISVYLNGKALQLEDKPVLESGRTLVPMRGFFEALGASVGWDEKTRTAIATRGSTTVWVPIGSRTARVNGTSVTIDVPGQIISSRTYVPLRFVSEALGDGVVYDPATRRIDITTRP